MCEISITSVIGQTSGGEIVSITVSGTVSDCDTGQVSVSFSCADAAESPQQNVAAKNGTFVAVFPHDDDDLCACGKPVNATAIYLGDTTCGDQFLGYLICQEVAKLVPKEVFLDEQKRILKRRNELAKNEQTRWTLPAPESTRDDDRAGLALSGGGIRSATLCLGIAEAMARHGALQRFDYLSTVSGGGYFGAFLAGLFTPRERDADKRKYTESSLNAWKTMTHRQLDEEPETENVAIRWLRRNSRYLAPTGVNDVGLWFVVVVRNLLAIHFVVGMPLMLVFYLLHSVTMIPRLDAILCSLPGKSLAIGLGLLLMIFATLPHALLYWFVPSERVPKSRDELGFRKNMAPWISLGCSLVVITSLLWILVQPFGALLNTLLVLALVASCASLWYWFQAHSYFGSLVKNEPTGSPSQYEMEDFKAFLSKQTYKCLWISSIFLLVGLSEASGRWVADNGINGLNSVQLSGATLGLTAFIAAGRQLVAKLLGHIDLADHLKRYPAIALLVLGLCVWAGVTVFWSLLAYLFATALWKMTTWPAIMFLLVVAALTAYSAISLGFLNQSTLTQPYSARLRRTYLRATNPEMPPPGSAPTTGVNSSVTDVRASHPKDDFSLEQLYDRKSLAPILLINCTLNQTRENTATQTLRDHKGQIFSVGPAGIAVGRDAFLIHQGLCDETKGNSCNPYSRNGPKNEEKLAGWPMIGTDFIIDKNPKEREWVNESEPRQVETLNFSKWIGISGSAISAGAGRHTTLGSSLLATALNVRLGHWWHPELVCTTRRQDRSWWGLGNWRYSSQAYLFREAWSRHDGKFSNFKNPQSRWYLSDGGHFENCGLYEQIRREVPFIVCADCGADPEYEFKDLSTFMRTVRADFGAEVQFLSEDQLNDQVHDDVRNLFGHPGKFKSLEEGPCALLATIRYARKNVNDATLLVLKPSITGTESLDVVNYWKANKTFPQQTTTDQFFDQGQWESYRALGFHMADRLFKPRSADDDIDPLFRWRKS